MTVWLIFLSSAKAEQTEPDVGRQHNSEEASGWHSVQCCLHSAAGLSAPLFFFFLLSLDAHNHVDDYSGTLGGVHKVHISALVTSP